MTATVIRGDARRLPLPDASVDLAVTSLLVVFAHLLLGQDLGLVGVRGVQGCGPQTLGERFLVATDDGVVALDDPDRDRIVAHPHAYDREHRHAYDPCLEAL